MRDEDALLGRYLDELDTWTRRLNLTTVPRRAAWARHVEESEHLLRVAGISPGAACVDIGSGGGIPGIVVAVRRPDLRVALLESDRRKAGFLVHVSGLLDLPNVTVLARRAEGVADDPAHRQRYDVAVSRAAAPPLLLVRLALPLLRPGGQLWALVRDGEAAAAAVREQGGEGAATATSAAPGVLSVVRPGG